MDLLQWKMPQSGGSNVAIGYESAKNMVPNVMLWLTAVGDRSVGNGSISGAHNTVVGHYAGYALTSGHSNTSLGSNSLSGCTSGSANVSIGYANMDGAVSGQYNVAVGQDCARSISSGTNNVMLGHAAGHSNSPSGAISTGSNNVVLGNNSTANLFCADTSISSSDSRDKTDITDFNIGLTWIEALRPVTYRWDRRTWYASGVEGAEDEFFGTPDGSKKRARLHVGFIAQEMLEVEKANGYGSSNDDSLLVNLQRMNRLTE